MPTIIVRYGELGLKSRRVRSRFEAALREDIRRKHASAGVPCVVSSGRGRIYVDSDDWRSSCELLSRTFGVVSFSPATKIGSDLDELIAGIARFAEPLMFEEASFAIRARRSGSHPYTSPKICEEAGSAVLNANAKHNARVDLDDPDVEIFVEVRDRDAYLFSSLLPGPGGLPKGTQGRVLAFMSSSRGLAAAWLLMKRGCTVVAACDEVELCKPLSGWDNGIRILPREGDPFAQAEAERCLAVVLDWSIDDLGNRGGLKGGVPVFYPLVGIGDDEAMRLSERIARI